VSVNLDKPHVFVLPEDDANGRLATGFVLEVDSMRQIQVLRVAGGWRRVLDIFKSQHVGAMEGCPSRFMVLLIDFDQKRERLEFARATIPEHLTDRVFVLGAWSNPEALKAAMGRVSYEIIGSALAKDCRDETDTTWNHHLLQHNASEVVRLREHVRPILF